MKPLTRKNRTTPKLPTFSAKASGSAAPSRIECTPCWCSQTPTTWQYITRETATARGTSGNPNRVPDTVEAVLGSLAMTDLLSVPEDVARLYPAGVCTRQSAAGQRTGVAPQLHPRYSDLGDCERCRHVHVVRRRVVLVQLQHVAARHHRRRPGGVDVRCALRQRGGREGDVHDLRLARVERHPREADQPLWRDDHR